MIVIPPCADWRCQCGVRNFESATVCSGCRRPKP